MVDTVFRWLFIAHFSFLTALRLFYKRKAGIFGEPLFSKMEDVFFIAFRAVLGIPLLVGTAQVCFFPHVLGIFILKLPLSLRVAGVLLGVASLGALVWVHRELGSNFTTSIFVRPGNRFIKTGPYRLVRHPMYLAYFTLFLAAFLMSGSWVVGISGLGIILMLMTLRLQREEENLIDRFGEEYLRYREITPRFLPLSLPGGKCRRSRQDTPSL
jgi:protein-S-isoprenylcysteine O-methyltransferase Ste14